MKALNLLLLLSLIAPAASFADEGEEEGPEYCSADVEYVDGTLALLRVECEGPYAGKCLKEVYVGRSLRTEWKEVECKR